MSKICYSCKEPKELSEFNKDRSRKDGIAVYCKECNKKSSREYHFYLYPHKEKNCEVCHTPLGEVESRIRFCPRCRKERDKESGRRTASNFRLANREICKARVRASRIKNKDKPPKVKVDIPVVVNTPKVKEKVVKVRKKYVVAAKPTRADRYDYIISKINNKLRLLCWNNIK